MALDHEPDSARLHTVSNPRNIQSFPREIENELSFKGQKLATGRHRVHPYPAMLHPLVVNRLLSDYARKGNIVFDPFCGSGAVLLGALIRGHSAVGFDINPLALLIAQAKTMQYESAPAERELQDLCSRIRRKRSYDIPAIKNLEYWYDPLVTEQLGCIRRTLLESDYQYLPLFVVCFAYVCRLLSYTRKHEFKRHREVEQKRNRAEVNVREYYIESLKTHIALFLNSNPPTSDCSLQLRNSEMPFDDTIQYDLIITSPPYGDHKTTVAYGQFSSFGNEWTTELNPFNSIDYAVDNEGLGRRDALTMDVSEYPALQRTVSAIERRREDRSRDVLMYFNGYLKTLKNICANLNPGGVLCTVVGNRTVAGIEVPLDQITSQVLDKLGLQFETIRTREISNKVMPLENSPSNKPGNRSPTMSSEHVVVFRKT